jgi:curved DNA-binding protein
MDFTDYYQVLGVARDADQAAIKAAYRKLARTLHPDVNKDPQSESRFKKVNEAYEVLKDPKKRAKYDRLGANWEQLEQQEAFAREYAQQRGRGGAADAGFSDFFEMFFSDGGVDIDELLRGGSGSTTFRFQTFGPGEASGGFQQVRRRGRDIEEHVDITLEEAARGTVRLLRIGERQVEVRIPAGVTAGSRVRVGGEGRAGSGGGERGDVFLTVRLRPHPRFKVHGRDLRADLAVRDDIAVLGGEVSFDGLLGPLKLTIPPGTTDGRIMRLRGKGLPGLRAAAAGDLLLTVRISLPAQPTEAERELYRSLSRLRGSGQPAEAGTTS